MRANLLLMLLFLVPSSAAVVDRVAIVIGKQVVTESEVLEDLRLTEFINNEPLEQGSGARNAAAEHLIDQELIRRELEMSGFAKPSAGEAESLLRKFRQSRFHTLADYRTALRKYGIAEDQLKQRLLWQVTAIRFIDFRFGSSEAAADAPASTADGQMEAWLKQARADTQITLKPEAFQ